MTTDLAWTGGDPDTGNTVTYDVYLDANISNPATLICNNTSNWTCDLPWTLLNNTDYYWEVVATDNHNASSTSSIWHFRTENSSVETLNFKVSFQARDNAENRLQNIPIKVKIKNSSGDQALFETNDWISVIPASGSDNWGTTSVDVSSAALTAGQSYQIFVRGAMHLAKRVTIPLTDGLTINYTDPTLNPDGFLWACDVDQDNQVSNSDINILTSHFSETAPANPDPSSEVYRSDQDGDGFIGALDLGTCLINFGKVGDGAPATAFSAIPVSGAVPLNVTFTDESSGTVTSWLWSFGDGNTSTEQNPQHTYTSPGLFTVALTATNTDGSHTLVKPDYITTTSSMPIWSPPINLSNSPGSSESPDVAISPSGAVHVVWNDNTSSAHDIFYITKSSGSGWSVPANVLNQAGDARYPSIAVDNSSTVHLAWSNDNTNNIYYAKKPLGGSWTVPEIVGVGFGPRLAVGSDASVHIVWVHNIGGFEIYYVVKPNGGSWSSTINLSNTSTASFDPNIALDSQNRPHVVWDDAVLGNAEIFYVTRLSNSNWSSVENISNNNNASHFAKIVVDSINGVHVFWPDNFQGASPRLFYSSKPTSGTWSGPVTLFSTYLTEHPDPAIGTNDVLRVTWRDRLDTFYTKQSGGTWLTPLRVSDNSAYGLISALDSRAGIDALVWMDEESGNQDIYYSEAADDAIWTTSASPASLDDVPPLLPTPTPTPAPKPTK